MYAYRADCFSFSCFPFLPLVFESSLSMSRLLTRVLHPWRTIKRHHVKKQASEQQQQSFTNSSSTVIVAPSLSFSTSSCLTESQCYRDDLVHVDALQHALNQQHDKDGNEDFFCVWNDELDRVYERSRVALRSLEQRVDELCSEICIIVRNHAM